MSDLIEPAKTAATGVVPRATRTRTRAWTVALGAVLCAGLMAGAATPSWANEPGGGAETPVVGEFALGDAAQGAVDERSGAFSVTVPLARLGLAWDSRSVAAKGFGFGPGWAVAGVAFVDTDGGVRVFPSRSQTGAFDADASVPSGLAGYVGDDLRFTQTPGVVPARADELIGERPFAFVLAELGGLVSYFDADGNPLTKLDVHGNRLDWVWGPEHQLVEVVTEAGVVTGLDWSDPGRVDVTVRVGGAAPAAAGAIELDAGRVAAVTDATGARMSFGYTASGLLQRVGSASGATTEVTWQTLADATAAVDRVTIVDAVSGEQVAERRWEAVAGLASGWPARSQSGPTPEASADPAFRTAITDGSTRVVSAYDRGQMSARETLVATPSGDRLVQTQAFTFPERDGGEPGRVDRPTGMTLTHHDRSGGARTVSEAYEFDEFGRVSVRTMTDGTVTTNEYDELIPPPREVPEGRGVPIGLPVLERTEAPDGSVTETRYDLNAARSAVIASETFTGTAADGAAELTRTGRSEFVVEDDGFVSTERVFPQGGAGDPLVTEHAKVTDLAAGTVTTTDTVAAGTALAATSTTVVDLAHGQPTAVTDVMGNTTTAAYDAVGRPVAATDAVGNTVVTEYRTRQAHGVNATVTTRADRVVETEERGVIGRAIRVLDNIRDGAAVDGHVRVAQTREHSSANTVEVTDAWGWSTITEHDAYGRVVRATVDSGVAHVTEYDEVAGTRSAGYTTTGDLADAELVTTEHVDAKGRVTERSGTRADGLPVAQAVSEFDGFGRQTRSSDGVSDTRVDYDVHGNPVTTTIEQVAADGATAAAATAAGATAAGAGATEAGDRLVATRRFDERGTSVEKTLAAAGEARTGGEWDHDLLGRPKTVTDQAGGVTSYEYTPDGLVAREATSAGAITTNTYDPRTRQLAGSATTSPVGDPVETGYTYDEVTGRLLAVFDRADPAATTIRYEHDAWGNVTRTTYPDGRTIEHGYDAHGRKIRTTDVTGARTEFRYEASGLLVGAVRYDPDRKDLVTASVTYTHDRFGRVTRLERGNGVRTEVTYTSASEIASETTLGPDGVVQSERVYAYDPNGNLTSRIDAVVGPEAETTTTTYRYDLHHRLVESTVHAGDSADGAVQTRTGYTLNVSGDVTREQITTDPGGPDERTTSREFTYSPTGQLHELRTTSADGSVETRTQDYDAAGNLTRATDGTRYEYDARNQPVRETTPTGATVQSAYWASGDRAGVTTTDAAGQHTTGFYWDDGTLLNDTHTTADATQTAGYLVGVGREARILSGVEAGPEAVYAVHDRHGSTTELTAATGAPASRYEYTDYGTTTTHPAGDPVRDETSRYPFLYAGEYTNPTGTQHLAVRTYAPERMSFTTQDSLPLQNRYGYANANPITLIDPSGHFAVQDLVHGLSTGLGVLFAVVLGVSIAATGGFAAMSVPTLVAATGFFLVDAASAAIGTIGLIDTYGPKFLHPEDRERLEYTEYGLMAAGAIGMALRAPKLVAKLFGGGIESRATKLTTEEQHLLIPLEDRRLLSANNEIATFLRGHEAVAGAVEQTQLFRALVKHAPEGESKIVAAMKAVRDNLGKVKDAYLTAGKTWAAAKPTVTELRAFVAANRPELEAVRSNFRTAIDTEEFVASQHPLWMSYLTGFDGLPNIKTPKIDALLTELARQSPT